MAASYSDFMLPYLFCYTISFCLVHGFPDAGNALYEAVSIVQFYFFIGQDADDDLAGFVADVVKGESHGGEGRFFVAGHFTVVVASYGYILARVKTKIGRASCRERV